MSRVCCTYIVVSQEGSGRTPHLQGYIEFAKRIRISGIKKLRGFGRAHLEVAKGSALDNRAYITKEGGPLHERGEAGNPPSELGGQSNRARFEAAREAARDGDLDKVDADILLRCYRSLKELSAADEWKRAQSRLSRPQIELRPWQERVLSIIKGPPSSRHIHFVYDPTGGAGKSTFARWLMLTTPDEIGGRLVQVLHPGRGTDLAYLLRPVQVYILDCPRASREYVPWTTVEAIKNGHVQSTKYECVQKIFEIPHLFVFCNELPLEGTLSEDRAIIINTCE